MKLHPLLCSTLSLLGAAFLPMAPLQAGTILFQDNFDGAPYSDNAALVTGVGQLPHGYWARNNRGANSTTVTTTASSLSPNRALALSFTSASLAGDWAQALALLSENGTVASRSSSATQIRLAFQRADLNAAYTNFAIRNSGEANVAVITLAGNGISLQGRPSSFATITAGTWYYLDITLPEYETSGTLQYSVSLFASDGTTLLGSDTSTFAGVATNNNYFYLSLYNAVYSAGIGSTLYVDDLSVAIVPEPSSAAFLLLIGGAGFYGVARRRKG